MKKILSFLFVIILSFALYGCSGPKPEATVEKYFNASQQFDLEAMAACIAPAHTEKIKEMEELLEQEKAKGEYVEYFLNHLKTNAAQMTYQITDTAIEAETAIVTVDAKYINNGPLLQAMIGELFQKVIGAAFSGLEMTEAEMGNMFMGIMEEQLQTTEQPFKEATVQIHCIKQNDMWYIAEAEDDLLDIALCGFLSAAKELSDDFAGMGLDAQDLFQ